MSRIVYGVSGEGSGHTTRAREMLQHLTQQGHEIRVVSYGRGYAALRGQYRCIEIEGLHIVSVDNRVSVWRTVLHNLRRARRAIVSNRSVTRLFDDFQPDCVITDFEPVTAWMAKLRGLPLISLDNQHRIRFMAHPVPKKMLPDLWLTQMIIALMIPRPDVSLATTLVMGPATNDRTFLFPPILRRDVLDKPVTDAGFHLVYLTSGYDSLMGILHQFPDKRFRVYGQRSAGFDGNITFCDPDPEGFMDDLAACSSVISTAGFNLISESMYLGKPQLVLPIRGQFEQELNAICLAESGYGMCADRASADVLGAFFSRLAQISSVIQGCRNGQAERSTQAANVEITRKLDEVLAELTMPVACKQN